MLEYIKAKVAEYAVVLSWIEQELQKIDTERPDHHQLIIQLRSRLVEAQKLHVQRAMDGVQQKMTFQKAFKQESYYPPPPKLSIPHVYAVDIHTEVEES